MNATEIAIPGTVIPSGALVSPGGGQGMQGLQGLQGPQGPTMVSADAGNIAVLGTDSKILVPQSTLWSMRLRSFNAIANPNFEITQRNCGVLVTNPADNSLIEDRWAVSKNAATFTYNAQSITSNIGAPGTNFLITRRIFRITLTGQQTTLTGNQGLQLRQGVEGSQLRELVNDVHSISLLVRFSGTPPISFSCSLRDPASTYSLVKLCTIASSGFQLITLPNLPLWTPNVTWTPDPGVVGYFLTLCFACGPTLMAPSTDSWIAGNYIGAPGMTNFASLPVNTYLDIAFVQHEPGPLCTTLIDCPFTQNYDACLRYFCKSYDYDTAIGSASAQPGMLALIPNATGGAEWPVRYPKPMAKVPTISGYNPVTGAWNSLRHNNGTDYAITGFTNVGKSGWEQISTATMPALALGNTLRMHYIADTGW